MWMWDILVLQLPPCHASSPTQLPVRSSYHPGWCFVFNSLVVRLPYSSIFWHFWLFCFLNWLLSFFWLYKEAKHIYLYLIFQDLVSWLSPLSWVPPCILSHSSVHPLLLSSRIPWVEHGLVLPTPWQAVSSLRHGTPSFRLESNMRPEECRIFSVTGWIECLWNVKEAWNHTPGTPPISLERKPVSTVRKEEVVKSHQKLSKIASNQPWPKDMGDNSPLSPTTL